MDTPMPQKFSLEFSSCCTDYFHLVNNGNIKILEPATNVLNSTTFK